jgi:hypothetical protein
MKKFYLHNGTDQQGPFDFEELKEKNISKETPIWFEGLPDWTIAEKIEELNSLFKTATPPPFNNKTTIPPPFKNPPQSQDSKGKTQKNSMVGWKVLAIILLAVIVIAGIYYYNQNQESSDSSGSFGTSRETYKEKVMSVEEIERSQPTRFLTASGNYNDNFFGDKIKVHGTITNSATVATYKDAVVKITYYSKTNTEIGDKTYKIYEVIPPNSTINFELKIYKYKNTATIGWDVIEASPY